MPREASGNRPWWAWLGVSAVVIVADLATKAWMSSAFRYGELREILPFFNLVLAHNTGAAFSFLADAGGWQRWFFTLVAAVISGVIVVLLRREAHRPLLATALSLVLGGALGNLHDRMRFGYVVDFIQLHAGGYYWPAFNVADSAICVGVGLLVWDGLRVSNPGSQAPAARQEKP